MYQQVFLQVKPNCPIAAVTSLTARTGHLTDGNFTTRLLYKDSYWTFISVWLFTRATLC